MAKQPVTNKIDAERLSNILTLAGANKKAPLAAYLYELLMASPQSAQIMEVNKMSGITLDQVLEELGYTKKWEARGEARGEARSIHRTLYVTKGLKNNISIEKLSKETELPIKKIKAVYFDSQMIGQICHLFFL